MEPVGASIDRRLHAGAAPRGRRRQDGPARHRAVPGPKPVPVPGRQAGGGSLRRHGVAVLAVALTVLLKLRSDELIGPGPPLILFSAAVTVAAWNGGLGPGLLALLLSVLTSLYLFVEPYGSLAIRSPNDLFRVAMFLAQGLLVSALMEALRAARRRADSAAREARAGQSRLGAEIRERRRAEAAMERSEGRLQAVLDSSKAVVFLKDPEGRYLLVSRPWAELFGVTKESVIGKFDHEIFPAAFAEAFRANDLRVLEEGKPLELEELAPHADGPRTYLSIKAPLLDADGRPYALCGIATDITERKRMEEALRLSEERFHLATRATNDAIWDWDLRTGAVWWNHEVRNLFGLAAGALGADAAGWYERIHPEDRGRVEAGLRAAIDGGGDEWSDEYRLRRGDGTYASVVDRGLVRRDGEGRPTRMIGSVADVTERRLSEARIRRLNEHLERRLRRLEALRMIDVAITSGRDLRETLTIIAEQARGHLGVDAAVLRLCDETGGPREFAASRAPGVGAGPDSAGLARRVAQQGCPLHVPDLARAPAPDAGVAGLLGAGFAAYHAVPLVAKGRANGVLELLARAPQDPDPEWLDFAEALAGQAAIAVDNAALVEGLRGAHAELASAYEATIDGWARALDLRDKETEGHSRRVTELTVRVARAMGVGEPELVHVRRGALLHDIGKMGVPDAILLKPGPLTEEEWAVMRRHPALAVAMLGPIEFLRPALEIPHSHHERWDGAGYPRGLRGVQIPLEARIFAAVDICDALSHDRPYRRAWPPGRVRDHIRSLAGTHLDPAVVEAVLANLDGPSAEGDGPGPAVAAAGTVGDAPVAAGRTAPACRRGLSVMVAEDDPVAAFALARTLEAMGHEVALAADGEEAWRLLGRGRVRVVIADWCMPGLDGPGLCRRIRGLVGRPYIYTLLLTGRGGAGDRLEGLAAGADDFLVKPADVREIAARLEIARRILGVHDDLLDRAVQAERMQARLRRKNERLAELVTLDPLTGLYNRRHLLEALEAQLALAARRGEPLSALILDVDRFKRFNDDFGHPAGDAVLTRVAEALRSCARDRDLVARYGGEEFVALLPGCDAAAAAAVAERVRAALAALDWPLRRVTASLGVATCTAGPWDGPRLLEEADLALYGSKRRGRDRVTHFADLASPEPPPCGPARARQTPGAAARP